MQQNTHTLTQTQTPMWLPDFHPAESLARCSPNLIKAHITDLFRSACGSPTLLPSFTNLTKEALNLESLDPLDSNLAVPSLPNPFLAEKQAKLPTGPNRCLEFPVDAEISSNGIAETHLLLLMRFRKAVLLHRIPAERREHPAEGFSLV